MGGAKQLPGEGWDFAKGRGPVGLGQAGTRKRKTRTKGKYWDLKRDPKNIRSMPQRNGFK